MPYPDRVETARLHGDRPTRADLPAMTAIVGDPTISEDRYPAALRTPDRSAAFLDAAMAHWNDHGFGTWMARDRASGTIVGRAGLMRCDVGYGETVEVGWFFGREQRGRGYATELARAALHHGFEDLELPEVVSFTTPANAPSLAVMRKLGMTDAGRIERLEIPHVLLRLTREAWAAQRRP